METEGAVLEQEADEETPAELGKEYIEENKASLLGKVYDFLSLGDEDKVFRIRNAFILGVLMPGVLTQAIAQHRQYSMEMGAVLAPLVFGYATLQYYINKRDRREAAEKMAEEEGSIDDTKEE